MSENDFADRRSEMVDWQIERRGVDDQRVLDAMRRVPREQFVPPEMRDLSYEDRPLPIGWNQTISQPYIVALMSELLEVTPQLRILEIGTGSGYQAAVLAEIGAEVFSIEIVEPLVNRAVEVLARLDYPVHVRFGDGYAGWPEESPFDRIIVTAAPPELPDALVDQLAPGGRMVVPVGTSWQHLDLVVRDEAGDLHIQRVAPVQFVPMVHKVE